MKKVLSVLAAIAVAVLLVGTLAFLWMESREPPATFAVETPFVADIVKKTVATGSVVPRQEVEIKPVVSGIVDEVLVEEGQLVRAGDVLARIRMIPDMTTLASAESRVSRARIALDDAERDLVRHRRLHAEGTVSAQVEQKSQVARDTAREELAAAREALDIIRKGTPARGGQVSNTLVRSTLEGMVLDVPVEVGSSVIESNTFNAGTTIATVADMGALVFEGKVDESDVGKIRPGMPLVLTIGAIEGQTFDAVLEHVAPKGKEEEGAIQFEIRAALQPKEGVFVRANYSASADIVLDRRDDVLAVKESVVQFEGDKPFVEVETAPQRFERRDVTLGLSDGLTVEVLSGVSASDSIKVPVAVAAAPRA